VACSGGGIRSASFSLGALQVLRERGVLQKASHVTAVSGGGYLAAGWVVAASANQAVASDVFAAGSPEESWLRRHTNLLPDVRTVLKGIGHALVGMTLNLLLLWLVLSAASRPIGWLEHVLHPELKGRKPYISIIEQSRARSADAEAVQPTGACSSDSPALTAAPGGQPSEVPALCVGQVEEVEVSAAGDPVPAWSVTPVLERSVIEVWDGRGRDHGPGELACADRSRRTCVNLIVRAGLVGILNHELVVLRQPEAQVPPQFLAAMTDRSRNADPGAAPLFVARQPHLRVVDVSVPAARPTASQLRIQAPRLDQHSGPTGRPDLRFRPWMVVMVAASLTLCAGIGLLRAGWRPVRKRGTAFFRLASPITAIAAIATVALLVVVPWLIEVLPPAVARLVTALPGKDTSAAQSGDATAVLAAGGATIVTVATIVRSLRGPLLVAARRWPLLAAKIVIAVVLVVVPFVVFVNSLSVATAAGPGGHYIGLWASRFHLPATYTRGLSDLTRWFLVLIVLAVWRNSNEAHTFSLFPFYKRRMNEAFVIQRGPDGSVQPVPYDIEIAFTDTTEPPLPAKGYGRFRLAPPDAGGGPELVLCATANTYRAGEAPSGRRAVPFTFSSTVIGGPDVGYMETKDYLDSLGMARRKDVTIPAVLAIAGAAFSPGMGKMSMGPIDNLLAITNARLGVWIPNPRFVAKQHVDHPEARWRDRPGWPWFLRELVSGFRLDTPYLYLTDGGHWENLGMVELLRRGCRNIVVISAAGDGVDGFATIGEAIALAREELDLEIAIDLEPMRPDWAGPDDGFASPGLRRPILDSGPPPPTLRRGKRRSPQPLAGATYRRGVIRDLRDAGKDYGTIVILEANLSQLLPWDVATWAEGHSIFPDDPTTDQNFNHRQFESYRRLGRFQMTKALQDPNVCTPLAVLPGSADPSTPP